MIENEIEIKYEFELQKERQTNRTDRQTDRCVGNNQTKLTCQLQLPTVLNNT